MPPPESTVRDMALLLIVVPVIVRVPPWFQMPPPLAAHLLPSNVLSMIVTVTEWLNRPPPALRVPVVLLLLTLQWSSVSEFGEELKVQIAPPSPVAWLLIRLQLVSSAVPPPLKAMAPPSPL